MIEQISLLILYRSFAIKITIINSLIIINKTMKKIIWISLILLTLIIITKEACQYRAVTSCLSYKMDAWWKFYCPCQQCQTGLTLSDYACCNPAVGNCATCSDASGNYKCLTCSSNYGLTTDNNCACNQSVQKCLKQIFIWLCLNCQSQIDNCYSCSDCNTCTQCKSEYYLVGASCLNCSQIITNCQTCANTTHCSQCVSGFISSEDHTICATCQQHMPYCVSCINASFCSLCESSYLVNANSSACILCSSVITNCFECTNFSSCASCITGYGVSNDTSACFLCSSAITNCSNCTNINSCIQCNDGYVLNNDASACIACSSAILNCTNCFNFSSCATCQINFMLSIDLSTCILCSIAITNCSNCNNISSCGSCITGYMVNNNTSACLLCSSFINFCSQCSDQTTCTLCQPYYMISSATPPTCQTCSTFITNCLNCQSSTKCIFCDAGFMVSSNFSCQPCSNILNCINCTSDGQCTDCLANYVLDLNSDCKCNTSDYILYPQNSTSCVPCLLLNCTQCYSPTSCISCIANYLIKKSGSSVQTCAPCHQFITNCLECTGYLNCTKCNSNLLTPLATQLLTVVCDSCSVLMKDCSLCNVTYKCIKCYTGKQVINGCTKVKGCFKVNPLLPITNNCLKCNPTQFLDQPQNQKCVCKKGKPVGDYCFDQPGCTNIYVYNNVLTCVSCNYSLSLIFNNGSCFCKTYFQWSSAGQQVCVQICADGYLINLQCDDGNTINGDGCSSLCKRETNYTCIDTGMIPASSCTFKAKIQLYVSQIRKQTNANQAIITFSILPYSSILQKVNFTNLYKFELNNAQIVSFIVAEGKLKVHIKYNASIEGSLCKLQLNYGYVFVRSPKSVIEFQMVQSFGDKLLFYDYQSRIENIFSIIVYIQALAALALLVAGSIGYKMIGVQTINSLQFIFLILVKSKYFQDYFYLFTNLSPAFGNLSIDKNQKCNFSSVYCRLGYTNTVLSLLICVGGIQLSIALIYLILKIVIHILCQKKQKSQKQEQLLVYLQKKKQLFYNIAFYPIFMGFLPIILITFLNNQLPLNKYSGISLAFTAIYSSLAIIYFYQIFKQKDKTGDQVIRNKMYVAFYHIYAISFVLLMHSYFSSNYEPIIFVLLGIVILFMIYTLCNKSYKHNFHNFCLIFNNFNLAYNIILVIIIQHSFIQNSLIIFFIFIQIFGFGLVQIFAVIRLSMQIYKKIIFSPTLVSQQTDKKEGQLLKNYVVLDNDNCMNNCMIQLMQQTQEKQGYRRHKQMQKKIYESFRVRMLQSYE